MGKTIFDLEELHCRVRCHASFQEYPKACMFRHNEGAEYAVDRVLHDDDTVTVKLQCCQVEYDEETYPLELCIEATYGEDEDNEEDEEDEDED
ncbi:hypothetical protein PILCRDRAFT_823324 [Piloderma croceum F 1598]|uniref:Uncharacterized protein n=1 Tax=Piloderma croceum (strain F 1598) TaxID=765440 RepID=A0A0C3F4Y2_PILCF|nr:hypothetical protein PILCRDRAFT_823324 [Piloderma croceum F 1598]